MLYEAGEGVATLTLNRPERLNALNPALREGLVDAIERVDRDPAVRVVVLQGAGDGFMAGGDVILFGESAGLAPEMRRHHFARTVAASNRSASSAISIAFFRPTRRGRVHVAPPSGLSPIRL